MTCQSLIGAEAAAIDTAVADVHVAQLTSTALEPNYCIGLVDHGRAAFGFPLIL